MIEKVTLSVFLFFNSVGNAIDPSLINDKDAINKIKKEIKVLERKKELVEVIEEDSVVKAIRTEKFTTDITKLKNKIVKIKKITVLKEKWAKEDSISKIKHQKLIEL
jgi:hypothetical protein